MEAGTRQAPSRQEWRDQQQIVSVGGFLGMGTRYVAVNSSDIQVSYSGTDQKWHAHISATSDELKSAPEFQYNGRWNASCAPQ